ncbi:phage head-tail connector protein [Streptomyces sp. NPDC051104]|uniref:phage head-tail connector protein n=1 Tax=Streptomyces sp. NPDC051104 TaxID=3155044 RepID=UPI003414937D
MAIVTLADAKAQLNISASDTSQDVELQVYVDAATAAVETQLGQVVEPRTIVDQLDFASSVTAFLLRSVPVVSLTSIVALDGTQTWGVSPSVVRVDGGSGCVTVLSGPPVKGSVLATYQAGMTVVPAHFRLAALIIVQHLWETQRGTMGVRLNSGGDDNYVAGRGFAIPRRAIELLGPQLPGVA